MKNTDSYLLLTSLRVCLVIAGVISRRGVFPIELQFGVVGMKILGAEMH